MHASTKKRSSWDRWAGRVGWMVVCAIAAKILSINYFQRPHRRRRGNPCATDHHRADKDDPGGGNAMRIALGWIRSPWCPSYL